VVNPPDLHAVPGTSDAARAANKNYLDKCVSALSADTACFPTIGDAPSFNVQLDPGIAKHWWKKIIQNIGKLPDAVRGSNSSYAHELAELLENAKRNSAK
jgi:hypothetical protein